uniref:glycosylphosphatidylinositol anchor attachment 1 protein n=1 Tax=Ciona intestinalis TaxID=7719 RepID=UPI000180BE1D|nr:glycosylphosphatidylinositol anchor attachment 1 protein [Ciona intestinalis]|eukprot:XP_002129998.1 glycosylphosphatidylinositol anchor attachment 1 protein [Ciona intestinalis]
MTGKLIKKVLLHANKLCVLSWIAGVVWFTLLSHYNFSASCYFSENALLPGLVDPQFLVSEREISEVNKKFSRSGSSVQALTKNLQKAGLEVYSQDFSYYSDYLQSKYPTEQNGTNVYAIARAARGATTESIILNIPTTWGSLNHATGIAVLLARQIRGQMHWAKDIVFLFSDSGLNGIQAWLNEYHGISSSNIKAAQLPSRAGAIQSAVVLNINDPNLSYLNLRIEGFNGQLPNLDLVNLVRKISQDNQMPIAINHKFSPYDPLSMESFKQFLLSTLLIMKQQITGTSSGNHGEFLRHNVEALTIEGVYNPQHGNAGLVRVGKMVEGICRSLNNLLERFHQSFFFYFLPSLERYVSIGMYMPALGLVLLAPVLKALTLLLESMMNEEDDEKEGKSSTLVDEDASDEKLEQLLQETGSTFADEQVQHNSSVWQPIILVIVICHILGVCLHYAPKFSVIWAEMFQCSQVQGFLLLLVSVNIVGMFLPYYISLPDACKVHFRIVTLIQTAVTFGTLSIINFPLGGSIGLYVVSTTLFVHSNKGRLRYLIRFMVLLCCPIVLAILATCYLKLDEGYSEIFETFSSVITQLYELHMINRSWVYGFVTVIYFPLWLQFWFMAS